MRKTPQPHPHRAFSLIELLVVIGIIVILIGIMVPVFFYARKAARVSQTSATLGNIANALEAYRADHLRYPRTSTNNGGSPGQYAFNALALALSNKNQGFRLSTEGRVYGPYLQSTPKNYRIFANRTDFPNPDFVLASGTTEAASNNIGFIDAWGQPIFYWVGNSMTGAQGQINQDLFSFINDASQNNRSYVFQDNNPGARSSVTYTVDGQPVNSRLVPYTPPGVWNLATTPWGASVEMNGDGASPPTPYSPNGVAFRTLIGSTTPTLRTAVNTDRILGRTSFLLAAAGPDNQYYTADDIVGEARR